MSANWIEFLGFSAAALSVVSFMPQAWQIIQTRSTESISMLTYGLTTLGFALWLAYGIAGSQWPLIIPNGICLTFASFILIMKILPQHQVDAVADVIDPTKKGDP